MEKKMTREEKKELINKMQKTLGDVEDIMKTVSPLMDELDKITDTISVDVHKALIPVWDKYGREYMAKGAIAFANAIVRELIFTNISLYFETDPEKIFSNIEMALNIEMAKLDMEAVKKAMKKKEAKAKK